MRYAGIDKCDITNGNDIGVSIFVQGCHFHCPGCFNKETWDFNGGKEWTEDVENQLIKLISKPYVKRVSILGGEPLADENLEFTQALISLVYKTAVDVHKEIKVWLYTGYTLEEIRNDVITANKTTYCLKNNISDKAIEKLIMEYRSDNRIKRNNIALSCSYLVDGRFEIEKQDLTYNKVKFAGSTNQRIIDVQQTLAKGEIVLYE